MPPMAGPPLADAVPLSVTEFVGKVTVRLEPALTITEPEVVAGSTTTVIEVLEDSPSSSVATSWKT